MEPKSSPGTEDFMQHEIRQATTKWKWKNPLLAAALAFVFGPLGFLYASWRLTLWWVFVVLVLAGAGVIFDFTLRTPWIHWGLVTLMAIHAYLDTRYKNSMIEFYKYGMVGAGIEKPLTGDRERQREGWGIAKQWRKLPPETLQTLQERLGPHFKRLDSLARKYNIFRERVFSGGGRDIPEMFVSYSMPMFLGSMGMQLAAQTKQADGEEALRLSIQLKPGSDNPSHVGLAMVLAQMGRFREAASEARIGIESMEKLDREMSSATESARTMLGYEGPDAGLRSQLDEIIRAAETPADSQRSQQSEVQRTPGPSASDSHPRTDLPKRCPKCGYYHAPNAPCGFLPGR